MNFEAGSTDNYLGAGARLMHGPAGTLADSAFAFELSSARYLWHHLGSADRAHVAALVDADIISPNDAATMIVGIKEMTQSRDAFESLDPHVGDVHNNRDVILREMVGPVAGVLNTGRARREATTIAWQLTCRDRLTRLGQGIAHLANKVVDTAENHIDTVMPDFTYLQHAQPTTLGHYLLGAAYPLVRTLERADTTYQLLNRSPAGSGSVNGSRISLDRNLLASLLGFDQLVTHARDAMWAPDMALQQMNVIVDLAVTQDRLVEDLHLWTTEEFGFLEIADSHSRTSVIMPQKKNPYSLAYLRGSSRHALGVATGITATMLTPTGQPDNRIFAYVDVPRSLDTFVDNVALLSDVLGAATFDSVRMERLARSGHAYATDLCDVLVVEFGVDNRSAHSIVGSAVRSAVEHGSDIVSAVDLRAAAVSRGVTLEIGDDTIRSVVDPSALIASRQGIGGAARDPINAMILELRERIESMSTLFESRDAQGFDALLDNRIDAVLKQKESS